MIRFTVLYPALGRFEFKAWHVIACSACPAANHTLSPLALCFVTLAYYERKARINPFLRWSPVIYWSPSRDGSVTTILISSVYCATNCRDSACMVQTSEINILVVSGSAAGFHGN